MELAAYLVISADGISMKIIGWPLSKNGLYRRRITSSARSEATPTTMRSGLRKSSMAAPSLRNSGLEATSNSMVSPRLARAFSISARTLAAVPTGTVLLVTMTP